MAKKTWQELDPRVRRVLVLTGVVEGLLKVAALVDLGRRRPEDVRGSKILWASAITLVNGAGAGPLIYFRFGRR